MQFCYEVTWRLLENPLLKSDTFFQLFLNYKCFLHPFDGISLFDTFHFVLFQFTKENLTKTSWANQKMDDKITPSYFFILWIFQHFFDRLQGITWNSWRLALLIGSFGGRGEFGGQVDVGRSINSDVFRSMSFNRTIIAQLSHPFLVIFGSLTWLFSFRLLATYWCYRPHGFLLLER